MRGRSAFFLASGAQKQAGFCTPEAAGLVMAPVTQIQVTFARTAVQVHETATGLMLRAEAMRLGLRFKLSILPPFCPFVGFHPPLCPGWWNCVRCGGCPGLELHSQQNQKVYPQSVHKMPVGRSNIHGDAFAGIEDDLLRSEDQIQKRQYATQ